MATSQPYFVAEQREIHSRYGGTVTRITLVGIRDRKEYTTYVDLRNRNCQHWQHIINNPSHGFIIHGLKLKRGKEFLISADSRPIIEWEHADPDVIASDLARYWDEEDAKSTASTFRQLFR